MVDADTIRQSAPKCNKILSKTTLVTEAALNQHMAHGLSEYKENRTKTKVLPQFQPKISFTISGKICFL
jgi:hypothetical protein